MSHIFFDTETKRFAPGTMAPPIVCMQFCVDEGPAHLMTRRGEFAHESGALAPPSPAPRGGHFAALCAYWINQGAILVGHHIAYDLACLAAEDAELVPLIFKAYRNNQVTDTMLRQKLADIGRGRHRGFFQGPVWIPLQYNLGDVGNRHGYKVDKNDPWRLHYELLADVPLAEWPSYRATVADLRDSAKPGDVVTLNGEDAIKYALGDPKATRAAYVGQAQRYPAELLCDEFFQARKFWALDLASYWGLRTSLRGVQSLERGARQRHDELERMLLDAKDPEGKPAPLVRPKSKKPGAEISRDTKAAKGRMRRACAELGITLRLTKSGDVCLDSDACNSSGDPMLEAYAEYSSMKKVLTNDVEMLRKGTVVPIHTHFDMADTGRVTASKPNTMNPRRLAGVRECFVPRGYAG